MSRKRTKASPPVSTLTLPHSQRRVNSPFTTKRKAACMPGELVVAYADYERALAKIKELETQLKAITDHCSDLQARCNVTEALREKNRLRKQRHDERKRNVTALSLDTNSNIISLEKVSQFKEYQQELERVFLQVKGDKYQFQGERDGKAINTIIKWSKGNLRDASFRWRLGLVYGHGFYSVSEIHQLVENGRWNKFAGAEDTLGSMGAL